eukprot:Skav231922  [mRNA]  locus=scaffold2322:9185:10081:- [translate_table: standard]
MSTVKPKQCNGSVPSIDQRSLAQEPTLEMLLPVLQPTPRCLYSGHGGISLAMAMATTAGWYTRLDVMMAPQFMEAVAARGDQMSVSPTDIM